MGLVLRYVTPTKAGTWHYRRRVRKALIPAVGKRELKRYLGTSKREALAAYPKVHAEFEKLLADAARPAPLPAAPSPLADYRTARAMLQEAEEALLRRGDDAGELRDTYAESALAAYPMDPQTREPVGMPEAERLYVNALRAGGEVKRPPPTLEDARDLYLKDRIEGRAGERTNRNRVALVMGIVHAALGKGKLLASLERPDARDVKDYMLADRGMTPATARRYVNVIRAIVTYGIREFGLRDAANPFDRLEMRIETLAKDERKPFTEKQIAAVRKRMTTSASEDLQRIFALLEGTGCRLAEVTGLLVADVVDGADVEIPYLTLLVHEHRRLKTAGSVRWVPLIGDALKAAREAVKAAGDSPFLFAAYARSRGADAASKALMKHVRTVVDDPKVVIHSLRHTMKDRLTAAGADEADGDKLLGHARAGQGRRYGGDAKRLVAAHRALKAALEAVRKA